MRPVLSIILLLIVLLPSLQVQAQESRLKQTDVVVKVFALHYSDANRMVEVIDGLFQNQVEAVVKVTTRADTRTNSVIASGSVDDLQIVESLLRRLDEKEPLHRGTTVSKLKNAPAQDVAQAINDCLTQQAIMKGAGRDDETTKKQTVVVAEPVSNSLIVSNTLDDEAAKELDAVIPALDIRPDTIQISVVIKQTKDGKETILAKPVVVTLDNMQASFTIGTKQDSMTVELTPRVTRGPEQLEMTRIDDAREKKKR